MTLVAGLEVVTMAPLTTAQLNSLVDHVHRYWIKECGMYPRSEDSMAIVMTIAALQDRMGVVDQVVERTPVPKSRP